MAIKSLKRKELKSKMKKLIFLFMLVLSFLAVKAQFRAPGFDYVGQISGPVLHNHGAAHSDTVNFIITGSRSAITLKYDITKTSGTITGTVLLQTHLTAVAGEQWATLNTYTFTNVATSTNLVQLTANPGYYYRLITATTDTSGISTHNKYLLYRK
jgi:hypothetical protein